MILQSCMVGAEFCGLRLGLQMLRNLFRVQEKPIGKQHGIQIKPIRMSSNKMHSRETVVCVFAGPRLKFMLILGSACLTSYKLRKPSKYKQRPQVQGLGLLQATV